MPDLNVNANRFDPYKNFKFQIKWDGRCVAGVSKVSALERMPDVVKRPKVSDPNVSRKSPGRTKYDAITLERGITHDIEFEQWASKFSGLGTDVAREDLRRDIIIEVYSEAGQLALAHKVLRCWVSEYQSLPDLDGGANAVRIQHMKLENEGIERDDEARPSRGSDRV